MLRFRVAVDIPSPRETDASPDAAGGCRQAALGIQPRPVSRLVVGSASQGYVIYRQLFSLFNNVPYAALDEQPRHDCLAGARVIGEKKAKGLTGQHGFVDRGDLMGQWLDDRGVHGEHRVEEMRQVDPLRLGDHAEQRAVSVEAPWAADLDDLDPGFVVTVQELIGDPTRRCLVRQLERFGAEPLHADHRDKAVGQDAAHRGAGLEIFKLHALLLFPVHIRKPDALPEGSTS